MTPSAGGVEANPERSKPNWLLQITSVMMVRVDVDAEAEAGRAS